ncbi:MAG: murein biosynthesis integral membrane protein MurJ [Bdellovibrionales bacterium]
MKAKQKQSVIRSAISMAIGTFSSRILGFLRDAVMFALFPRTVTDAWSVAFRLPNVFRRLMGEGSLAVSFIPIYQEARTHSEERARQLSNAVFTIVFAIAMVISVTCFVYMEQILWMWVGDPRGFAAVPGKVETTIYLARIMIFYLLLVSTYAFHMAVANSHGYFFIPAIGPTLFNFGLILFTVTRWEIGGVAGSTQSWGVIFGGVLQMGVVMWLLIRQGILPRLTLKLGVHGVGRVFANLGPGLFGIGVFQVMTIVNTKFAARLSEGSQSYIYLADRILEMPQSLIAVSLGAALLPRFSELHSRGETESFLQEANHAVRLLLYLSLPSAIGMYFLSIPITQVLFQHGAFSAADTQGTAQVVEIYSVLLLFSSLSRVTAPAFYAIKNTWLPACVALFVLIVHISIGPWLVEHYQLPGLARATSASAILNIVILQFFFYFWIGPLGYGSIFRSILRLIPALAVLALVCVYAWPITSQYLLSIMPQTPARSIALTLVISVGAAMYFYVTMLCGSSEAKQVFGTLGRKLFKKK